MNKTGTLFVSNEEYESHRVNLLITILIFTIIMVISNIVVYNIATANVKTSIKASEKRQKEFARKYVEEQIFNAKVDILKGRSDITKHLNHLDSKYNFLENMIYSTGRTGYIVIEK